MIDKSIKKISKYIDISNKFGKLLDAILLLIMPEVQNANAGGGCVTKIFIQDNGCDSYCDPLRLVWYHLRSCSDPIDCTTCTPWVTSMVCESC